MRVRRERLLVTSGFKHHPVNSPGVTPGQPRLFSHLLNAELLRSIASWRMKAKNGKKRVKTHLECVVYVTKINRRLYGHSVHLFFWLWRLRTAAHWTDTHPWARRSRPTAACRYPSRTASDAGAPRCQPPSPTAHKHTNHTLNMIQTWLAAPCQTSFLYQTLRTLTLFLNNVWKRLKATLTA